MVFCKSLVVDKYYNVLEESVELSPLKFLISCIGQPILTALFVMLPAAVVILPIDILKIVLYNVGKI